MVNHQINSYPTADQHDPLKTNRLINARCNSTTTKTDKLSSSSCQSILDCSTTTTTTTTITHDDKHQQQSTNGTKLITQTVAPTVTANLENEHDYASAAHAYPASQCGHPRRVRSLVGDAKFDTLRNKELVNSSRRWLESIQWSSVGEQDGQEDEQELDALLFSPPGSQTPAHSASDTDEAATAAGAADLEEQVNLSASQLLASLCQTDFPRHISQLDQCNHLLIKYEPELDPTHPGFHDPEYRARRKEVAQIAFNYKYGNRIPEVQYHEKEVETWRYIYIRLKEAYGRYACWQHNKAIEELERHCGYSPDSIPQLQRVSEFLECRTGWRLRPVAGLLSARDFLASLAYRVFQTTQYIRHWGNPEHSVEPDCIHELMGHIPILCDPNFAQFSQEIGLASLGASDEQIEKFATLYWFTVEFGLCREGGQLKCYGAGLLSSYGEMEHALESGKPALKEFVPEETAIESYDDSEYQVSYYVAESFEGAKLKIKQYAAKHLRRQFELAYDPYSCSVRVLDSLDQLDLYADQIRSDMMRLSSAISRLKLGGGRGANHLEHNLDANNSSLNEPAVMAITTTTTTATIKGDPSKAHGDGSKPHGDEDINNNNNININGDRRNYCRLVNNDNDHNNNDNNMANNNGLAMNHQYP